MCLYVYVGVGVGVSVGVGVALLGHRLNMLYALPSAPGHAPYLWLAIPTFHVVRTMQNVWRRVALV